jgi:PKD domain-containing protein
MTPDIILLIGTIVIAVLAVFVGLIRAVLERRRGSSLWEQYRSRRIDPQRLERAVPGPTAVDGTIRALEKQAPAMGSRSGFAAIVPVTVELIGDSDVSADDASPAHPYAYAYARESDAPDSEIESVAIAPAVAVADHEAEPDPEVQPEVDLEAEAEAGREPEAHPEPGLSDAAMAELGIVTKRKRRFGKGAAAAAPVSPPPVEVAWSDESAAEPAPAVTAAAAVDEAAEPAAAATAEPVPLFLPGTYTEGAADLEEPAIKRDDAPTRAAAMTAGYAPTARAVFVPPPPDVIEEELAYRIGVRGARRPEQAATEVADGPAALAPVLPTVETEVWPERRGRARRRAAIGMTAIAAAVVLAVGANTLPGLLEQGGVLSATGQPPASAGGGVIPQTPSPTPPPATSEPTPSSAAPSPSPSAAASGSVTTASVTPRPTRKPIRPPFARFDCTSEGLVLTCDGSKSSGATDYMWDFGEDATVPGVTASHTYKAPGSYLVTLTVTGPTGSTSRSQSFIVP